MALTKVRTGGIAADAVDNTILKLDDNYAFTGTISGAGGLIKLLSATISSAVSEYDISSTYINSTYDEYRLFFNFKPATNNTTLRMRVFVGGSVQTGNIYAYEGAGMNTSQYVSSNAFDAIVTSVYGIGNDTGESIQGEFNLQNINSTTFPFMMSGVSVANNEHGNAEGSNIMGALIKANVGDVVNGIRFFMNSGNIASGTVKLYGIAK